MDVPIDEDGTSISDFIEDPYLEDLAEKEKQNVINKKASILKQRMKELKNPYREVLEMREISNMSYEDIAVKLGSDTVIEIDVTGDEPIKLPYDISEVYSITKFIK